MGFISSVQDWFAALMHECWVWFTSLSEPEWIMLLAIGATFGFLCMRGFRGRGNI